MKKDTIILKAALLLMALADIFACYFFLPRFIRMCWHLLPDKIYVAIGVGILYYGAGVLFIMLLYDALRLLILIDRQMAFSKQSVHYLRLIRNTAVLGLIDFCIGMPLLYLIADADDAPGLIVYGMMFCGVSLVIAVFASVLQKLFVQMVEIKSDHDLTI